MIAALALVAGSCLGSTIMNWHEYQVPFTTAFFGWPKFYAVDGNELRDYHLMRRRVHGEWQYRKLTDEEEINRCCNDAW